MFSVFSPIQFRRSNRGLRPRAGRGFALVVVLAFLVLMLVATMAFFSKAQLERQTSGASTANIQSDLLFDSALEIIVGDLRQEMAAGSSIDNLAATNTAIVRRVYEPITINTTQTLVGTNVLISTAPSMVLQRVVASNAQTPTNLVKQSLRDKPFFTITSGYTNHADLGPIANRASAASTTNAPLLGRAISTNRWTMPRLAGTNEILQPPDWIYINRDGGTPTTFAPDMATRATNNGNFIVGRFAYNIYDTGGLIDINVVGNTLAATNNARRGRLHQVSLTNAPAPLAITNFTQFIAWRAAGEPANTTNTGGLFDAKRTFTTVPEGSQAFVTRQDLLRYVAQTNVISTNALPFLTTFSRDLNAPSYSPEPNRPLLPISPSPQHLNPALMSARFSSETTLSRGSDPDITVPAGTSVITRRFPLSKVSLLAEESPDAETLKYYFGLLKNSDGSFDYTAAIGGRIAQLSEVAALGREPNFFEILQATITTGSLGRFAGNSFTVDYPRDKLRNIQVVQIGANLIDQGDTDDLPTEIRFPDGAGGMLSSYGIENLPYLNNFSMIPHRPEWDQKRFQVWGVFDVWNPHRNAGTKPKDISGFRIRPTGGKGSVSLKYALSVRDRNGKSDSTYQGFDPAPPPIIPTPLGNQDILVLNPSFTLDFDANGNYTEPTVVGSGLAPQSSSDHPGFLMWENPNVPPALPAKADRSAVVQSRLNSLMDNEFPYDAKEGSVSVDGPSREDPDTGDRIYLATTLISGLDPKYWNKSTTPSGETRIYANYPVKAHNWFRYTPAGIGNKTTFELQYKNSKGEWRTYQIMNQFMPRSPEPEEFRGFSSGTSTFPIHDIAPSWDKKADAPPPTWWKDTHHSISDFDGSLTFYEWRAPNNTLSFYKIDPRTTRFGYFGNQYADMLGTTIRISPEPLPNVLNADLWPSQKWRVLPELGPVPGKNTANGIIGPSNFTWLNLGPKPEIEIYAPLAMMINAPDGGLSAASQNVGRYGDLDGIIRPADGYLGALPTVPARMTERPVILNRPFRSVGEIGYVFRDMPWKTLDFFSRNSGDLGLLDVFSVDETEDEIPSVAGKVNLNSARPQVLQAILLGTGNHADMPDDTITEAEAMTLSTAIQAAVASAPFRDRGDLVRRLLSSTSMSVSNLNTNTAYPGDLSRTKVQREAAIRTLSEIGSTRTWNLLIDLIVQTGRFPQSSQNISAFAVKSERRYWVHLAIDRMTGFIVAKQLEVVNE